MTDCFPYQSDCFPHHQIASLISQIASLISQIASLIRCAASGAARRRGEVRVSSASSTMRARTMGWILRAQVRWRLIMS